MKVKFLRDYHGLETNETRFNQGSEGNFPDEIAQNLISRKIVVSIEPVIEVKEKDVFDEVEQPAIKIVEPKVMVKRGRKSQA